MKKLTKKAILVLSMSLFLTTSVFALANEEDQVESGTDPKCHCWDVTIFGVHIVTKCNKYCGDFAGWDWF